MAYVAIVLVDAPSPPSIQMAPPNTLRVIQPSVPAWTWVRSVLRGGSQMSVPLRIPITTVMVKITRAARNSIRDEDGIASMCGPYFVGHFLARDRVISRPG